MEKTIKLIMSEDKTISIALDNNDNVKYIVKEDSRNITAQTIYELLDYKHGDHFTVITENGQKRDENVLLFFKDFFDDICTRINALDFKEDSIINANE